MKNLAELHTLWLEKESKAKNERDKKIAQNKIQEILNEAKKLNIDLNAENLPKVVDVKDDKNAAQKMETDVKNEFENEEENIVKCREEIEKILRVFKFKMMDAETSNYLKELQEKVERLEIKEKTTVGPNNVKYQTESGEIYYFNRLTQSAYFENGAEYGKEELTKLQEDGISQKGFEVIHYLKSKLKANYVNI